MESRGAGDMGTRIEESRARDDGDDVGDFNHITPPSSEVPQSYRTPSYINISQEATEATPSTTNMAPSTLSQYL
jgi:hypothetical protein